jgi:hypothetical protein
MIPTNAVKTTNIITLGFRRAKKSLKSASALNSTFERVVSLIIIIES